MAAFLDYLAEVSINVDDNADVAQQMASVKAAKRKGAARTAKEQGIQAKADADKNKQDNTPVSRLRTRKAVLQQQISRLDVQIAQLEKRG